MNPFTKPIWILYETNRQMNKSGRQFKNLNAYMLSNLHCKLKEDGNKLDLINSIAFTFFSPAFAGYFSICRKSVSEIPAVFFFILRLFHICYISLKDWIFSLDWTLVPLRATAGCDIIY